MNHTTEHNSIECNAAKVLRVGTCLHSPALARVHHAHQNLASSKLGGFSTATRARLDSRQVVIAPGRRHA